ncbi:hypothetical protein Pelo_15426 [Pelomyxa schiedti]|nr:hypothetical protein Pelo_15426 [Pelomyxa schiedti]
MLYPLLQICRMGMLFLYKWMLLAIGPSLRHALLACLQLHPAGSSVTQTWAQTGDGQQLEQWDEFSYFSPQFSTVDGHTFHIDTSCRHDTSMKLAQKRNLSLLGLPYICPSLVSGYMSPSISGNIGLQRLQQLSGPRHRTKPFFLALWATISRTLMPTHKPGLFSFLPRTKAYSLGLGTIAERKHCRRTPAAGCPYQFRHTTTTQTITTSPTVVATPRNMPAPPTAHCCQGQ